MATKKKSITFYADEDIAKWYDALPPHQGGRRINDSLRYAISHKLPDWIALESNVSDLAEQTNEIVNASTGGIQATIELAKVVGKLMQSNNKLTEDYQKLEKRVRLLELDKMNRIINGEKKT